MIDRRAHIVTADLTYRGHVFSLADDGTATIENRGRTDVLRQLTGAEADSRDGQVYRVVGRDADGVEMIWRVVGACARCAPESIMPTPSYDIPT